MSAERTPVGVTGKAIVRLIGAATIAVILVAACGDDSADTTTSLPATTVAATTPPSTTVPPSASSTTVAPTTTGAPATTTAGSTTTGGAPHDGPVTLLVPTADVMGPGWEETLFIPYGDGDDTLGTSPGGDGGSVDWGPEYGTQTPDGTWWFLDGAKLRLAHFDGDGGYLGAVELTEDQLVNGLYFQFQMPQALDNGVVVASGLRAGETELLVLDDGIIEMVPIDAEVSIVTTDGEALYGDDIDNGFRLRIGSDGSFAETEHYLTRVGTPYGFQSRGDEHLVELPDAGVTRQVTLRWAEDPDSPVFGGTQVETGLDGTLHVYVIGVPEIAESTQVAAYYSVSPNGEVSAAEPSRNPFSPSDPGSPANLGVDPLTGIPWLMFVDTDGVRVYTRSG